jgi:DNA-binding XRE family transcriptional regulator
MARTNLKVFRVSKNMTQDEMSKDIGYCRTTFCEIESGKREGRASFWKAIKNAYDLDDDTLNVLKKND